MTERERLQGKARALVGRAAAASREEHCVGPRVGTGTVAHAVGIAFRAGVQCDRCKAAPAVGFRTRNGHTSAFCERCRPTVENYRLETLQGVVNGWRGRGGETRDRSVAAAQRRLNEVMGRV